MESCSSWWVSGSLLGEVKGCGTETCGLAMVPISAVEGSRIPGGSKSTVFSTGLPMGRLGPVGCLHGERIRFGEAQRSNAAEILILPVRASVAVAREFEARPIGAVVQNSGQ